MCRSNILTLLRLGSQPEIQKFSSVPSMEDAALGSEPVAGPVACSPGHPPFVVSATSLPVHPFVQQGSFEKLGPVLAFSAPCPKRMSMGDGASTRLKTRPVPAGSTCDSLDPADVAP